MATLPPPPRALERELSEVVKPPNNNAGAAIAAGNNASASLPSVNSGAAVAAPVASAGPPVNSAAASAGLLPVNSGAAVAAPVASAAANGSAGLPVNSAAAVAAPVAAAANVPVVRETIMSKANFNSAEKIAMAAKAEETKKIVEIDVPTQGSSFKTYQVPHEQVKTLPLQGLEQKSKKLILPEIDQIYEKYMIDKMNDTKDGKQYVRITYLNKDYLVQMQPMDTISDIKKEIEKTSLGSVLNKLSSVATGKPSIPFSDVESMSLIQLALEKQQFEKDLKAKANANSAKGIKVEAPVFSNNDRIEQIKKQMLSSIEMMDDATFKKAYDAKSEMARSGSNEDIDAIKLYEKERLLRADETRTKGLSAATLSLKDLPIELERIEREYIRAGKPLDSLHTDRENLDAEKYRALRDRFQAELAKNDERWGWWKDWKDPRFNRFRPKKGGYTSKKSKKNNKTKKSTRRSS